MFSFLIILFQNLYQIQEKQPGTNSVSVQVIHGLREHRAVPEAPMLGFSR